MGYPEERKIFKYQYYSKEHVKNIGNSNFTTDSNSSSWGNYSSKSIIDTGSNTTYEANGIYDLAGNCWEWTQEACTYFSRLIRRW